MSNEITFSVIIPVYNTEKYLRKSLDSVLNQSYRNFEALIVNDGSTDASEEVIRQYLNDSRFTLISQANKGLGGARNTGIQAAKGEYLVFLDSDDYLSADCLKTLADVINNQKYDVVVFDAIGVTSSGQQMLCYTNSYYSEQLNHISRIQLMMMEPTSCFKSYKRTLFLENHIWFPERLWYEDFATTLRLALHTEKNCYIKKSLYFYVQQTSSITHTKFSKRMLEIETAFNIVKEYYEGNHVFDIYKDELEWNCFLHLQYYSAFRLLSYGLHYKEMKELSKYFKSVFPAYKSNKYLHEYKERYYLMEKVYKCDWVGFFVCIYKERLKSRIYEILHSLMKCKNEL